MRHFHTDLEWILELVRWGAVLAIAIPLWLAGMVLAWKFLICMWSW